MTTILEHPTVDVDPDVLAFYTDQCDEAARLTSTIRGRLEATRLRELLMAHLPANGGRVADVGGGPGVHASWLQNEGHTVDLLDPIPRHIDTARDAGIRSAVLGDARSLPWADDTYDAVLMAGPMYHLTPAGRAVALREAVRVAVPGGVVAAVAVNRYANLMGAAVANQLHERRDIVNAILANGYSPNNDRVPHMYYHSPDELAAEFERAGLSRVRVMGLTGPGGWLTVALDRHFLENGLPLPETLTTFEPLQTALMAARDADALPDLTASSGQLMAFGYRE
jgi:SAM-dependent methyltransferase